MSATRRRSHASTPDDLAAQRAAHAQALRIAALALMEHDRLLARRRRARRTWAAALLIAAGSIAGVFQSCSGGGSGAASRITGTSPDSEPLTIKHDPDAVQPGADGDSPRSPYEKAAVDLDQLFRSQPSLTDAESASGPTAPPPSRARPAASISAPAPETQSTTASTEAMGPPAALASAGPADDSPSIDERRARLTTELASLIRPDATSNPDLLKALTSLIVLEAVTPGAAAPEIEAAMKPLSPPEASAARVVRDLVRRLASDPALIADPDALRDELTRNLDLLRAGAPAPDAESLSIPTLALCSRVESFGRYTPLPGARGGAGGNTLHRFLAGRTNSAIVYIEVDHFTQQTARSGDAEMMQVELATRIELFHDDGSRQWRAPDATVRDSSRTRRRDFFVVQRIDLPATLSVGRYNLKVGIHDRLAPGGAETEILVPIEIVADPSLLGEPSSTPGATGARPTLQPRAPIAGPEPLARGTSRDDRGRP